MCTHNGTEDYDSVYRLNLSFQGFIKRPTLPINQMFLPMVVNMSATKKLKDKKPFHTGVESPPCPPGKSLKNLKSKPGDLSALAKQC